MECGKFYDAEYVKNSEGIPRCSCGGMIKPDVVLYEEGLDTKTIQNSVEAIAHADMLIIGGTSLVVYPAAGFIDYFRGKYLVLINKAETGRSCPGGSCDPGTDWKSDGTNLLQSTVKFAKIMKLVY